MLFADDDRLPTEQLIDSRALATANAADNPEQAYAPTTKGPDPDGSEPFDWR